MGGWSATHTMLPPRFMSDKNQMAGEIIMGAIRAPPATPPQNPTTNTCMEMYSSEEKPIPKIPQYSRMEESGVLTQMFIISGKIISRSGAQLTDYPPTIKKSQLSFPLQENRGEGWVAGN